MTPETTKSTKSMWERPMSMCGHHRRSGLRQAGTGTASAGRPGITAEAGTIFTVNGSAVEVENTDGIALLFDDIIEVNTEDKSNSQLLADRADKELQSSRILGKAGFNYELKYLNLVMSTTATAGFPQAGLLPYTGPCPRALPGIRNLNFSTSRACTGTWE